MALTRIVDIRISVFQDGIDKDCQRQHIRGTTRRYIVLYEFLIHILERLHREVVEKHAARVFHSFGHIFSRPKINVRIVEHRHNLQQHFLIPMTVIAQSTIVGHPHFEQLAVSCGSVVTCSRNLLFISYSCPVRSRCPRPSVSDVRYDP